MGLRGESGIRSSIASGESINSNVAIVGGGVLGMYLAWQLRDTGAEVTLFEGAPKSGGLASEMTIGETRWDRFYHVILMSDRHLIELLKNLDLEPELRWGITRTGFYTDGELVSMSNTVEFLRFPPLNILDKLRLGATIFYASRVRNWQALEKITAVDWLTKLSGRRVFNKIWLPLLKSKLGDNYKVASAAFIWAIIARMYAARRAGLKQEQFGYVQGGYAAILDRLQRKLDEVGVKTIHSAKVSNVVSTATSVTLSFAAGASQEFDHVVMTIPADTIADACPQFTGDEKERLRSIEYQGIICPSFLLKKGMSPYYVTNITDSGIPFTGVIEMTALVDPAEFDGRALVYLPQYLTQSSDYWNTDDAQIYDDCLSGLERMYPEFRRTEVVAKNIARARKVLAISTLDYSVNNRPAVQTSLPNVFILNSAQIANGTLNVNETLGVVNSNLEELVTMMGAVSANSA